MFVQLFKCFLQGTLEEKIYQRQISKQSLSGAVMDCKGKNDVQFSLDDLKVTGIMKKKLFLSTFISFNMYFKVTLGNQMSKLTICLILDCYNLCKKFSALIKFICSLAILIFLLFHFFLLIIVYIMVLVILIKWHTSWFG